MSPSAIVYASATGFTRRYADLLSERTGLPCFALGTVPGPDRGAAVLYLGWLCAGGIKGLRKARARYKVQAVCAVGMSLPGRHTPIRSAPKIIWRTSPFSTSGAATPRSGSRVSIDP